MKSTFKASFQLVFRLSLLAVFMVLPFQNCSNSHDPSPFEFHSVVSASTSLPFESRLDSPMGVIDVSKQENMISVGGECNVGGAPKHMIEVRFFNSANQLLPAREDTLCPPQATTDPQCLVSTISRCEHGRYYVVVPVNASANPGVHQAVYRLTGQLVTYDSKGAELRDPKASFDRQFQISW